MNDIPSEEIIRDKNLVFAVCSGDTKVFEQLVNIYKSNIYAIVLKIVADKNTAKDLINEVFEKVFRNISQYDGYSPFSAWLFRIAQNHARDNLRRRKTGTRGLLQAVGDFSNIEANCHNKIESGYDNPEESMIKDENAVFLHRFVSDLHPRYRLPLEMRYFGEYSLTEISNELNLPVGTIKTLLFRSRKMLQKRLINIDINSA